MKKITSFTSFNTADGLRLSYTYSEINEEGIIIRSNVRRDLVVVDKDLKKELDDVFDFLNNRESIKEN